jgi:hypothetical protein
MFTCQFLIIELFEAGALAKVKSMIDCCPDLDCQVGTPGVLISVRLLSSNQFLCCVAWPLVVPSNDQFA